MSEEDLLDQLSDLNGECVGLREKVEDLTAERGELLNSFRKAHAYEIYDLKMQIDDLKAEVEKILERERETIRRDAKVMSLVCEDRDHWKALAERAREALEDLKNQTQHDGIWADQAVHSYIDGTLKSFDDKEAKA